MDLQSHRLSYQNLDLHKADCLAPICLHCIVLLCPSFHVQWGQCLPESILIWQESHTMCLCLPQKYASLSEYEYIRVPNTAWHLPLFLKGQHLDTVWPNWNPGTRKINGSFAINFTGPGFHTSLLLDLLSSVKLVSLDCGPCEKTVSPYFRFCYILFWSEM